MVQVTVLGVSLVSAAREIDAIRPERFSGVDSDILFICFGSSKFISVCSSTYFDLS